MTKREMELKIKHLNRMADLCIKAIEGLADNQMEIIKRLQGGK